MLYWVLFCSIMLYILMHIVSCFLPFISILYWHFNTLYKPYKWIHIHTCTCIHVHWYMCCYPYKWIYIHVYIYIDTLQNINWVKTLQNIKLLKTYPNTIIIYFYFRSDWRTSPSSFRVLSWHLLATLSMRGMRSSTESMSCP